MPILVILSTAVALHYNFDFLAAFPAWVLLGVAMYLYRDPTRKVPASPLAIIAPIDSTVVAVEKIADPYVNNRDSVRIRLHSHMTGVFTVRSPMEGKITNQWFNAYPQKKDASGTIEKGSKDAPYPFAQWTTSDEGDDVVFTLRPRLPVVKPRCLASCGERIGQGQRCSFIPFGANVDVYVPANSKIEVKVRDTVNSGSSIIAVLVR